MLIPEGGTAAGTWRVFMRVEVQRGSSRLLYDADEILLFSNHDVALMSSALLPTVCYFCGRCFQRH